MKYNVTVLIDASCNTDVEADSPAEAADKAMNSVGYVTLCHQCSGEVDIGDCLGALVYDDDGVILDTTFAAERAARLESKIAMLQAEIALLEAARGK